MMGFPDPLAWLWFVLLGAVAGVLAGLLGVGGGLVLVAALAWLLPTQGIPQEAAMHAALATSLASIVFTASASARAHHRRGSVVWKTVAWMVPGILAGGWLGSRFAVAVDGHWLRWGVAGYCFIAALQLLCAGGRQAEGDTCLSPQGPGMTAAGGGIGVVSALVGIGGGSMTVPLLVWRGVPAVRAVGTSSACGMFIGLASAAGYAVNAPAQVLPQYGWGYVYLPAAICVALASVALAPLGTRLAHAISGRALKRVFALFLLAVGTSLLL